ncbi:FAD-dependent oxidoreductase [Nocardia suismassiliense]|uniref:FAD-dependent oxidoreductase n=1 Tax=Nocardia suismassiliense TaxID=2077092 RepID=UPI00131F2FD0|nr:FAD-dependent oxidoreductase [Nocardia suismassiliense]
MWNPPASGSGIARRRFIQGTAAAAGLAALSVSGKAVAPARAAPAGQGDTNRRVAVFGGGTGGLTVAHELVKRGFSVDVYERHEVLGGRARSWGQPNTGTGGRKDLSIEFGPHVLLGSYQNLGETLLEIPTPAGSVLDQAIPLSSVGGGGRIPLLADIPRLDAASVTHNIVRVVEALLPGLSPAELPMVTSKLVAMFASGRKRQFGEFDRTRILDYLGRPGFATAQVIRTLTTLNPSAITDDMSVRGFNAALQNCDLDIFTRGMGPGFRDFGYFIDGGMDEGWFDPWAGHLRNQGVGIHVGHAVTGLSCAGGRIVGATVRTPGGTQMPVQADWFVIAATADKAAALMNPAIVAADPALGRIAELAPSWLGGMQIFLRRRQNLGVIAATAAGPWLNLMVDDTALWTDYHSRYGDGSVAQHLSIDVGAWETPGILFGKTANWCTARERFEEVRAQLRHELRDNTLFADEDIHSIIHNPSVFEPGAEPCVHDESGIGQDINNWVNRPEVTTGIPNLFFGSAFAKTYGQIDSTDCANEAGRRAANAILLAAGSNEPLTPVSGAEPPPMLKALWEEDDRRYDAGLPNVLDVVGR